MHDLLNPSVSLDRLRGMASAVWVLGRGPSLARWGPREFFGQTVIAINSAIHRICPAGADGEAAWCCIGFDWKDDFAIRARQALPHVRHVAPYSWLQINMHPAVFKHMCAVPWTFFHTSRLVGQPPEEISGLEPPTILAAIMLALLMGAQEINLAGVDLSVPSTGNTHFNGCVDRDRTRAVCEVERDLLSQRVTPYCRLHHVDLLRWKEPGKLYPTST